MIEEDNLDEISESERLSLRFNEMLDNISDNTDYTSSTFSDIDFEELEDFGGKLRNRKFTMKSMKL
jgi:hypothetical protein